MFLPSTGLPNRDREEIVKNKRHGKPYPSASTKFGGITSKLLTPTSEPCPPADDPQGKVAELRQELVGVGKKDKNHVAKKTALKKIVANMTMSNNDMVGLFPEIIECMRIPSLEIKKM